VEVVTADAKVSLQHVIHSGTHSISIGVKV